MNLESIVTSIELSQKLDEIGVKQQSFHYWKWSVTMESTHSLHALGRFGHPPGSNICAFTAQELWDILDGCHGIAIVNNKSTIGVPYAIVVDKCQTYHGKNISDCLAQLIIAQKDSESEDN